MHVCMYTKNDGVAQIKNTGGDLRGIHTHLRRDLHIHTRMYTCMYIHARCINQKKIIN